jgi:hypothetical protein
MRQLGRQMDSFLLRDALNARTVVEGPAFERLKMKTTISWAHDAVVFLEQRFQVEVEKEHHYTAFQFIYFAELNTVFLQDAA